MESLKNRFKQGDGLLSFTGLLLVVILCTLLLDQTEDVSANVVFLTGCIVLIALIVGGMLSGRQWSVDDIMLLLFLAGFLLRLYYVLYTEVSIEAAVRQHDVAVFGSEGGTGQEAYIEWFYNHPFRLHDASVGQFYHPPLHHWLAAIWMRLLTTIGMSYARAVTSIQYLTLFYSSCCMLVSEKILRSMDVKGGGRIVAFAIIAFHPEFILLAGSVNNDILAILMILLTIYFTIRWYQQPTLRGILKIALSIGLGMSTKLTAAVIAPPVAVVFLIKMIHAKGYRVHYIGQYVVFGVVCIPLGLWYTIWKYIEYGLSAAYVPRVPTSVDQYVGEYSLFERLFDYSYHPFEYVFVRGLAGAADYYEYNPFVTLVKTSLFDEFSWYLGSDSSFLTSGILLWCNILLIMVSLAAMLVYAFAKDRMFGKGIKVFLISYYILLMGYYLVFCFQYPHTCSMNFRYIVPTCVVGAVCIGWMLNRLEDMQTVSLPSPKDFQSLDTGESDSGYCEIDFLHKRRLMTAFARSIEYVIVLLTILFSLFSTLQFLLYGLRW